MKKYNIYNVLNIYIFLLIIPSVRFTPLNNSIHKAVEFSSKLLVTDSNLHHYSPKTVSFSIFT